MFNHKSALTLGGVILGVMLAAASAHAWVVSGHMSYLTISAPVSLPGVTLGSGTYVFEMASPDTSADVVRVASKDRKIIYFLGFTRLISRPSGLTPGSHLSLGEAAGGAAPPITAWFPEGDSIGHQFVYGR